MQLDRTEIVIRQRSALELFDLSLLVLKRHFKPMLMVCGVVGIPLLALDVFAVSWMMSEDSLLIAEDLPNPVWAMRWRYISHLVLLFVMQFPLISLPATVYLGNRIFFESISMRQLFRRIAPISLRSIFVLGVVRLGLVGLVMEFMVNRDTVFDSSVEPWILFVVAGAGLFLRACYPFAPEILGLELCPLRSGRGAEITYRQRSRGLHRQLMAEHFTRFVGSVVYGLLLALMLLGTMLFLQGMLFGIWQWNITFDLILLPITMWLVGIYMAVFRFLSYLDSRIRLEGWEIELRMRAEAERLTHPTKVSVSTEIATEQVAS